MIITVTQIRKQKLRDFPNVSEKVAAVVIHGLSLCISSGAKQKRKWEKGYAIKFHCTGEL